MRENNLTMLGHLAELRKRLLIIFLVNVVSIFVCYEYADKLTEIFLKMNPNMKLVYLTPPELFLAYVKISLVSGAVIVSPITLSQIWGFIGPGLYKDEKNYLMASLFAGVIFFLTGSFFAYKIVLPTMLSFFARLQIDEISAMISVGAYLDFICSILFTFGIVFEIPVVVALLAKLKILRAETLRKKQPILIMLIFIVAALMTPPDIVSQIMLAVPMIFLLQLSIGICWMINKSQEDK
ncbi:MAG: twin-arginine translocase subunit TatC [Cetobacterium sp.]